MNIENQIKNSMSLLDCLKGLTFGKGITLSILTGVVTIVLYSIVGYLAFKAESVLVVPLFLLPLIVSFYGVNAVGILNFKAASGQECSISDAVSQSLKTSHRLILLGLLFAVSMFALYLVTVIALYICKIPAVGPWIYGLVYPVGVILYGLIGVFFMFVFTPLAPAAIWSGAKTTTAFKTLVVMAKRNIASIAIKSVLLSLILMLLGTFVGAVIAFGTVNMNLISLPIFINGNMLDQLYGISYGPRGFSGSGPFEVISYIASMIFSGGVGINYMAPKAFGTGLIAVLSATMVGQVAVRGFCLIFLSSKEGVADVEEEFKDFKLPEGFKEGLSKAKEVATVVAQQAKEKGSEAAIKAKEKAEELAKKAAEAKEAHDEKVRQKELEAKRVAEEERALEKERIALEREREARLAKELELKKSEVKEKETFLVCKKCGHKCDLADKFCEDCGSDL